MVAIHLMTYAMEFLIVALGQQLSGPITANITDQTTIVQLTLSIGAARRWDCTSVEDAFKHTDITRYTAKENGPARLTNWNDSMQQRAA